MDMNWTFPIQPDHLEPCVDQDATYSRFLKEQDALDAMLWGDSAIPPIESCPDSQYTTGFGVDPNIALACACDFPPLDCSQHCAYHHMSTGTEPSPSLFNLEQTTGPFNDVPRPLQHVPQRAEFTEGNLMRLSSCQNQCEIYHPGPISPKNDQDPSTSASRGPRISSKARGKQPLQRSKINSNDKQVLKAQFSINPYPGKEEVDKLHRRTGLAVKCIKTWFSNIRYRTAPAHPSSAAPLRVMQERQTLETPSQASTCVSAERLKEWGRVSPTHSTSSLERYLATPLTEEAIPSIAFESLSETFSKASGPGTKEELDARFNRILYELKQTQLELGAKSSQATRSPSPLRYSTTDVVEGLPDVGRPGSIAGSNSSVDSRKSAASWTSQNSVGSRGSRRGRKIWVRAKNQYAETTLRANSQERTTIEHANLPWYCTSLDCDKSFQYRYAWDRHEAAVHHWPYHWICNVGTGADQVHKDVTSRIFFRQDQYLTHMKGAHPEVKTTKEQASALRENNPDFSLASLICGFCGCILRNWGERQDHVAIHMQKGSPKSSWLCKEDLDLVFAWANNESLRKAGSSCRLGVVF